MTESPGQLPSLADLILQFDNGEIRLPLMQRDYVWRSRKVTALLDSIYRGWPIGSFYIWRTRSDKVTRARKGRAVVGKLRAGWHGFLLDGQQRLTSLSLSLQGEGDGDMATRALFDLERGEFVLGASGVRVRKRIEKGDPLLVPLYEIVVLQQADSPAVEANIDRKLRALAELELLTEPNAREDYRQKLRTLSQMLQRPALCEEFVDEDEKHAFELFARLNKGGTSLKVGDVAAAQLASDSTRHIVEPMREMAAEPRMRALGVNFLFLLRALVTVHRENCSFSKLPKGWASSASAVDASWKRTEVALRFVVELVGRELGWTHRRWLPSTMALLPLTYLFAKTGTAALTEAEATLVRRYLQVTGLRGLFRGATETTVNSHLVAVRNGAGSRVGRLKALFNRIPKNRRVRVSRSELLIPGGAHSSVMQVYLSVLHTEGARSWPSGEPLIPSVEAGEADLPVVRQIFPKRLSLELLLPIERFMVPANCAVVSRNDDKSLGDETPSDSWKRMKPSQRQMAAAQQLPEAAEHLLWANNFDEFLQFRAGRLAERLNSALGLG